MSQQEDNVVVLVADDEPSTLALVASHLRSKGHKVFEASDGDQAWQLAHEYLPDLVVLDVMMPGMSGWEVCRKIREAVSLAHTGVIMLTGIGENLNEMTSPLYGADAYLDKPFEFSDLDARVDEVLTQRRSGAMGRPDAEARKSSPPPPVAGSNGTVVHPSLAKAAPKRAKADVNVERATEPSPSARKRREESASPGSTVGKKASEKKGAKVKTTEVVAAKPAAKAAPKAASKTKPAAAAKAPAKKKAKAAAAPKPAKAASKKAAPKAAKAATRAPKKAAPSRGAKAAKGRAAAAKPSPERPSIAKKTTKKAAAPAKAKPGAKKGARAEAAAEAKAPSQKPSSQKRLAPKKSGRGSRPATNVTA